MKKGTFSTVTGLLLIAAALCLTGYNLMEDHQASNASGDALQQLELLIPQIGEAPSDLEVDPYLIEIPDVPPNPTEVEYPDYVLNPEMDMPTTPIYGIEYIGVLSIPRLNLKLPIIGNFNMERLRVSPCRYKGSPYKSNFVICAHNYDSHFGRLKNLDMGDKVYFTDLDDNVFAYRVLELEYLDPEDVEGMVDTEYWDMTLFTCTVGGASRVTVRCVYDE